MSKLEADDLRWALQRRIEDVFAKLGEKFGDLTGRVETDIRPSVSFDDIGGLVHAKATVRGFAHALTSPDLYQQWGITPPKGVLLYGPPGTGKSKLARALATSAAAIFYHVKLFNLTSKFAANTGELLQEILRIAMSEGKAVLFLDEAEALSLEHLLPPPQAREASARLVATLCERLDGVPETARILVIASTSRTDAVDAALVTPGRLDHLVEVALPDADEQREILELLKARMERDGRYEWRRHHGDPPPGPRGEGAPGRRGWPGLTRQHAGPPGGDRPLQACAQRGREDPLRPVPVISTTKIRVRYADTDCMKVVYYANYLTYFEVARVEFLRQQGHAMSDVDQKVHMPVVEAVVRYHKPALLDDLLEARCWIAERKRASFRFGYELMNDRAERVATGSTLHACWDPATSKMIAVPDWLAAIMPVASAALPPAV